MANSFYKLGRDLQRISDSATWAEYRKEHPEAKVGFVHKGEELLLTLTHEATPRYASGARQLLEMAYESLQRMEAF